MIYLRPSPISIPEILFVPFPVHPAKARDIVTKIIKIDFFAISPPLINLIPIS